MYKYYRCIVEFALKNKTEQDLAIGPEKVFKFNQPLTIMSNTFNKHSLL